MTNEEKLRSLLAEARERLQDVEVALADAQFLLRADAALAEPVKADPTLTVTVVAYGMGKR
jgi:hypothetical protein